MSDVPDQQNVKLQCLKCEDLYNPKSSRHAGIDGAYFGTSFPNILTQVYPALIPKKSAARYEPKIFGFKVHAAAALQRWQESQRQALTKRLKETGIEGVFKEDEELMIEDDEDEEMGEEGGELAGDL